jgi:hypothetical protein
MSVSSSQMAVQIIPLSVFEQIKHKTYIKDTSSQISAKSYIEEYEKLETVLDKYLKDIIADISSEIDNISDFHKNSVVVAKKNPRLLSKYINKDNNINLIKCEINKLASTNFSIILETVLNIINTVDSEKIVNYIDIIHTLLINKCYLEDNNICNYVKFILEIGKLEKYSSIIELFNSYLKNIFIICDGEISWLPGIKTESGISHKVEYFISVGRLLGELVKLNYQQLEIINHFNNNLQLANKHLDISSNTSQEKRVQLIIGFSQTVDINKYIPIEELKKIAIEMHILNESKLAYKYKYRMMDWFDAIKKIVKLDISSVGVSNSIPSTSIASNIITPSTDNKISKEDLIEKKINSNETIIKIEPVVNKISLFSRINSIIEKDINTLINPNIISKFNNYVEKNVDTSEFTNEITNVFNILVGKVNQNQQYVNVISEFLNITSRDNNNLWLESLINYIDKLHQFNSININWQNNGVLIFNLMNSKILSWKDVEKLVLVNKKDINKVCEIKLRINNGINSIGAKKLSTSIAFGSNIQKYITNLNNLIQRVSVINNINPLLVNTREFVKLLEKNINTKSANRFDLLQSMMVDLE